MCFRNLQDVLLSVSERGLIILDGKTKEVKKNYELAEILTYGYVPRIPLSLCPLLPLSFLLRRPLSLPPHLHRYLSFRQAHNNNQIHVSDVAA